MQRLSIVFILNLHFRRLNQRERDALQKNFLCCSAYLLHFGGSKSSGSVTSSFVVIYHFIFTEFNPNCSLTSSFVVIYRFIFTEFDPNDQVEVVGPVSTNDPEWANLSNLLIKGKQGTSIRILERLWSKLSKYCPGMTMAMTSEVSSEADFRASSELQEFACSSFP